MENPYAPPPLPVTPPPEVTDGYYLVNAPEAYRRALSRGLSFILTAILFAIIMGVVGVVAGFVFPGQQSIQIFIMLLQLVVSLFSLAGHWLYTAPDPGQDALAQVGSMRRWVRVTVITQLVIQGGQVVLLSLFPLPPTQPGQMPTFTAGFLAAMALGLVGLLLFAAQFVAVMFYTRELALRIPDALIVKRTMLFAWLLPVIAIAGIIACGLGPLVALVLYWNLLDRLRKHVKSINATGMPAALSDMAPLPLS